MIARLPVTQFLLEANGILADGRDPVFYLQCLVKYWEMEQQSAATGWARRYSMRMRRGALAALRQMKRHCTNETNQTAESQQNLESKHEHVF